ncbi:PQQ-binding-like beta-propeller repeat protein [Phenylobacterium sp.]|uniref:outer membrane protein assembly factor BamB family protein n=1 Tax=Phenylobacterium sp. TaxID=1871053 RepID=UPI003562389F
MRRWLGLGAVFALEILAASPAGAQTLKVGETIFNTNCKACHDPAINRAPDRATLRALPPASIIDALTGGVMQRMGSGLSPAEKQSVATYLSGLPAKDADQSKYPIGAVGEDVMCATPNPPIRLSGSDWTSVGVDAAGRRFQPRPGLTRAQVRRLKVKWSFAMTGGGAPTVVGDWLFIANRSGKFYALDSRSGCVRWVVDKVVSRTTPMVVRSSVAPSGWLTLIGLRNRTARAFDAQTGKTLWTSDELDTNPVATITGTPLVVKDTVMVPLTSGEEGTGGDPKYPCCSFRGSVAALDLATGKQRWKTYVIPEPLKPTRLNKVGTQLQGPAGAAIWSAPVYDRVRDQILVATGDSYTDAPTKGADAIVAIDRASGAIRWSTQVDDKDNFVGGCTSESVGPNCPLPPSLDVDFGASPIVFHLKGGRDVVLSGQKSGLVYGMDAASGKLLWTRQVSAGSPLGGVEWGMAADGQRLYAAAADTVNLQNEVPAGDSTKRRFWPGLSPARPGLTALDPATGKVIWQTPTPVAPCRYAAQPASATCIRAQSQAPSAMPGVVFGGAMDGWFRAYDAATGKVIWADSTTSRTYDTVNHIKGQPGGSLDGMGAAIAGGRVFVMSGFNGTASIGGNGVNVLLAYSVDGK